MFPAFSAFLDFAYAIYPATVFFDLNMPTVRKIELSILMGLGAMSGAVAIYKTSLLHLLADRTGGPQIALYESVRLTMWTGIEANIIIIAACIPLTTPIMRMAKKRTTGYLSTKRTRSTNRMVNQGYEEFSKGTNNNGSPGHSHSPNCSRSNIYVQNHIQVQSYRRNDQEGTSLTDLSNV
jgi:hypothetical protein